MWAARHTSEDEQPSRIVLDLGDGAPGATPLALSGEQERK